MRIFNAVLIIFGTVILFLLPLTAAIYDFRTDQRTDTFSSTTGVGVVTANVTLFTALYDDDLSTVGIASSVATDSPLADTYNSTSRLLNMTGLTANSTRTLEVSYDIDSLTGFAAISTLLDRVPFILLLIVLAFPGAALFVIIMHKD